MIYHPQSYNQAHLHLPVSSPNVASSPYYNTAPANVNMNTNTKGYQYHTDSESDFQHPQCNDPRATSSAETFKCHLEPYPPPPHYIPLDQYRPDQIPPLAGQYPSGSRDDSRPATSRNTFSPQEYQPIGLNTYDSQDYAPQYQTKPVLNPTPPPRRNTDYDRLASAYPSDSIYKPKNTNKRNYRSNANPREFNAASKQTTSDRRSENNENTPAIKNQPEIKPVRTSNIESTTSKTTSNSASTTSPWRNNPSEGRNRMKQRDPKMFDGQKIEWVDYLQHFETVSKWNKWSEEQKAQQLVMSFDGEAMKLLGELSEEVLHDYKKLTEELNRRYDPLERAQAYKIEFRSRHRHKGENFMKFAQDLKRLVTRAYPNMPSVAHDQFVLDQFITGLSSIELRKHVQFGHPTDLNQAMSLAIEFEAFNSANAADQQRKPRGEVNMVRPYSDDGKR